MDSEEPPKPETPTDPLIVEALAEAVPADAPAKLRKRGGRAANARRGGAAIRQLPWTDVINIDRPTEPLPPEGVDAIHNGAMRVLEEIGIEFLHPDAVAILRDADRVSPVVMATQGHGAERDHLEEVLAHAEVRGVYEKSAGPGELFAIIGEVAGGAGAAGAPVARPALRMPVEPHLSSSRHANCLKASKPRLPNSLQTISQHTSARPTTRPPSTVVSTRSRPRLSRLCSDRATMQSARPPEPLSPQKPQSQQQVLRLSLRIQQRL